MANQALVIAIAIRQHAVWRTFMSTSGNAPIGRHDSIQNTFLRHASAMKSVLQLITVTNRFRFYWAVFTNDFPVTCANRIDPTTLCAILMRIDRR